MPTIIFKSVGGRHSAARAGLLVIATHCITSSQAQGSHFVRTAARNRNSSKFDAVSIRSRLLGIASCRSCYQPRTLPLSCYHQQTPTPSSSSWPYSTIHVSLSAAACLASLRLRAHRLAYLPADPKVAPASAGCASYQVNNATRAGSEIPWNMAYFSAGVGL